MCFVESNELRKMNKTFSSTQCHSVSTTCLFSTKICINYVYCIFLDLFIPFYRCKSCALTRIAKNTLCPVCATLITDSKLKEMSKDDLYMSRISDTRAKLRHLFVFYMLLLFCFLFFLVLCTCVFMHVRTLESKSDSLKSVYDIVAGLYSWIDCVDQERIFLP